MIVRIENEHIAAQIKTKGAELVSLFCKENQLEYIWDADPVYWGKTSPVLFPIVGTLKSDTYVFHQQKYGLNRHGFARDDHFEIYEEGEGKVSFRLKSNEATYKNYPFSFELYLHYQLEDYMLRVSYEVKNRDEKEMFFSIGGHPAFKVPLVEGTQYQDYYLLFNKEETAGRWPLDSQGLIKNEPVEFFQNNRKLSLQKELFHADAIVLKNLRSDVVALRSDLHNHGLDFHFEGFPYFGIWAAKNADFVCLEPWCGIADHVDHNQNLEDKEGIQRLAPLESWSRTWKVRIY